MPVNTTPRMWKVTFKNATTGEQDTVYPTAITRADAVELAKENTKMRPEECTVSATTNFDHFDTVKKESNMDLRLPEVDESSTGVSWEEELEDTSLQFPVEVLNKSHVPGEPLSQQTYDKMLEAAKKSIDVETPVPQEIMEQVEVIDPLVAYTNMIKSDSSSNLTLAKKPTKVTTPEERITKALVFYFVNRVVPTLTIQELVSIFEDTWVSFSDFSDFLLKHRAPR